MNRISGCIHSFKNGKTMMIDPDTAVSKFELDLGKEKEWIVGIDQSTSCTGICLYELKKQFMVNLDVKNCNKADKITYFRDLKFLLKRITETTNIKFLVYERPAPKDMYASRVLQELKGRLEEWISEMPWLEDTVVESMYQQTWKSYVVDKSKGKNRSKYKRAIAEDVCDVFPHLRTYLGTYPFGDSYDSFDATGIVLGYLRYAFDPNGIPKIHGVIEKTHVSTVGYCLVDKEKFKTFVQDKFDMASLIFKPKFKVMATEKKMFENVRMASSNNSCIYTIVDDKYLEPFIWKFGLDPDDDSKVLIMTVLRKGDFTVSQLNLFREMFPWNEEIRGE